MHIDLLYTHQYCLINDAMRVLVHALALVHV